MDRKSIILVGLLLSIFLIRHTLQKENIPENKNVRITTGVLTETIKYEKVQYLKIKGLKVYLPLYPEIIYGDKIVVEGTVKEGELTDAKLIEITKTTNALYKLREKIISFYKKSFPQPHSSLVSGVVVGSKSDIPRAFWEKLKSSGTAHVVVASGMNVTLVAGFVTNFLISFIKRRKAVILSIITIWLYALISGFDAPIIRAAIMGTVAFSAVALGRVNGARRGLLLSAGLMLAIKPIWVEDLGFWLSFVATASLMLFEARIRKFVMFLPQFLREGFSTSLSAQIGVAPILYFYFGQFNIFSPLINMLVLWTIAPLTIIGMIAGIVGIVSIPLGKLILYLSYPLSFYFVKVVEIFG